MDKQTNESTDRTSNFSKLDTVVMCSVCKRENPRHASWSVKNGHRELCCECHVKEGNAPSDWHQECLYTYRQMNT